MAILRDSIMLILILVFFASIVSAPDFIFEEKTYNSNGWNGDGKLGGMEYNYNTYLTTGQLSRIVTIGDHLINLADQGVEVTVAASFNGQSYDIYFPNDATPLWQNDTGLLIATDQSSTAIRMYEPFPTTGEITLNGADADLRIYRRAWSLINVPVVANENYLAENLGYNLQAASPVAIFYLLNNRWVPHVFGSLANNFNIVPGRAYMIYATGGNYTVDTNQTG